MPNLASLTLSAAAPIWLDSHQAHVAQSTLKDYKQCIRSLLPFFSDIRLRSIRFEHFERYQRRRLAGEGWKRKAGPSRINHELNTLSQILNRAGLWEPIARLYKPLPLPRPNIGRALEPEDAERLYRIASSNPRWLVAYCCALISVNSTADGSALRFLRLKNIHLDAAEFDIEEGEKNRYRLRTLPLNESALWAMKKLIERAKEKGATEPDHYLLPHRARNGGQGFDPTRPMFAWRGAWIQMREAAKLPKLRFKDLRHTAITDLLEDENVSERTVIDLAGHVGRAMLERYSHIRMKTKRAAVDALTKVEMEPERPARNNVVSIAERSTAHPTPQPYLAVSSTFSFMVPLRTVRTAKSRLAGV
jgi:integrase